MTELEILQQIKAGLQRKASERETRRKWYEREAGTWLKKPVTVTFRQLEDGVSGHIRNMADRFEIDLHPGNSLQIERSTWSHETSHGALNHDEGWTPETQKKHDLTVEFWQDPEMSKRLGVDVKGLFQERYRDRTNTKEEQADFVGEKIFHFYWPGDEYVKHNSTGLQMQTKFK